MIEEKPKLVHKAPGKAEGQLITVNYSNSVVNKTIYCPIWHWLWTTLSSELKTKIIEGSNSIE